MKHIANKKTKQLAFASCQRQAAWKSTVKRLWPKPTKRS